MTATGIDFGTTNSVVAQWSSDDVEVLPLDAHHLDADWRRPGFDFLFPSVVGMSSLRRGPLFGWEAKLRSEEAAEACKRLLKSDEYVKIHDRRFAATTVAAGVFQAMKEGAQHNLTDIDRAVITVPANATGAARYRTRAAARFAGIEVQALLNEPTAAAISYVHDLREDSQILVFDWGGGTIDVTVLDYADGFFEERASRGVTELGGLEIDRRLRKLILGRAPVRSDWTPAQERQFRLDVERSKILLSCQDSVVVMTPEGATVEIHQEELAEAITDLVDRSLVPLERCLDDLHMAPLDVDAVLMIGGTSQIPSVRAAVAEALQTEPVSTDLCDPMTAVARGASVAAAVLSGEAEGVIQVATGHALGTVVTDTQGRKKFSQIIPRNSPLPWSERKSYTPRRDHASELRVEIWEGDPDKNLTHPDNVQLTELTLNYPERRPRDESRFELEYTYDTDGLLHVKAELERTGEVVVDQEVRSFGSGGPTPAVRKELAELLAGNQQVSLPGIPSPQRGAPARGETSPARPHLPAPPKNAPRIANPAPAGLPRALVVDGSNIAWIGRSPRKPGVYESDDRPSFLQLLAARAALASRYPDAQIHMVVDATLRHRVAPGERAAVQEALSKGDVIQPPAGTEGKGDALVAAIADDIGAVVVTNDNYVELQPRYPWLREQGRVLGATLSQEVWIFAPRTCVAPRHRG
ncbi:Hsp70 family protein [Streptomyces benahoarensis]|uniref:Hsp70 family protein n=1 Tax=Streptomyces benahoarensis TaxID=2595054 RepID=A0A553ZM30_9ACTN|nr:Hsp70 family protein [Streptomyces benahoarensis]TSB22790.1 Hsp70 family protein [Streptomyces benahoarensis]TSB42529.1 Hsp70 family protein [Streptomyces benahoarensis]